MSQTSEDDDHSEYERDEASNNPDPPLPELEERGGLIGLVNLGNTCFMNAALQCILNDAAFARLLLSEDFPRLPNDQTKLRLVDSLTELVHRKWRMPNTGRRALSPQGVFNAVGRINPHLADFRQHDSEELLNTVLDAVHDSTMTLSPEFDGVSRSKQMIEEQSLSTDVFGGSTISQVVCTECGNVSSMEEKFFSLPLSIPSAPRLPRSRLIGSGSAKTKSSLDSRNSDDSGSQSLERQTDTTSNSRTPKIGIANPARIATDDSMESGRNGNTDQIEVVSKAGNVSTLESSSTVDDKDGTSTSCGFFFFKSFFSDRRRQTSLEDCLDLFTAPEELDGEDRFECLKCKVKTRSSRTVAIRRCPSTLIIQLKRFRFDGLWSMGHFSSKNSDTVLYPSTLNLSPFVEEAHQDAEPRQNAEYELTGVVNHYGFLGGGHYIAYCKHPVTGQWHEYDDTSVTPVTESDVLRTEAYILMYRRKRRHRIVPLPMDVSADNFSLVPRWFWVKYQECATPGRIDTWRFLCPHGNPKAQSSNDQTILASMAVVTPEIFNQLHTLFGSGGAISSINQCQECLVHEAMLKKRRESEWTAINSCDSKAVSEDEPWFIISKVWLDTWLCFVQEDGPLPGKIANNSLLDSNLQPLPNLRRGVNYRGVNKRVWDLFTSWYGGGPPLPRKELNIYSQSMLTKPAIRPRRVTGSRTSQSRGRNQNSQHEQV